MESAITKTLVEWVAENMTDFAPSIGASLSYILRAAQSKDYQTVITLKLIDGYYHIVEIKTDMQKKFRYSVIIKPPKHNAK